MKGITFFEEDREPTPDKPNKIITGIVDDNAEIYINRLEQENKQLKEEKRKAIEYIKSGMYKDIYDDSVVLAKPLLEILGDKENE
jgi:predicted component of type VI protein secretion system